MEDIAASLAELGILGAARDAHMIVSLTSRYQWVRWQATINLMELATMDSMEAAFDDYAAQLRNAALDPRLRSYFLLYFGQGCIAFGREADGIKYLSEARDFAAASKINQVMVEAEKALAAVREKVRREPAKPWTEEIPAEVSEIAHELALVRATAQFSPAVDDWS